MPRTWPEDRVIGHRTRRALARAEELDYLTLVRRNLGLMSEDRHNPLPHIALLSAALKSTYKNTVFLSTRTSAELRELLIR